MSDDTKALVERLRHAYDDLSDDSLDAILIEAAAAIERLERELAEALGIIDTLHETCAQYEERLSIAEPIMRAAIAKENAK